MYRRIVGVQGAVQLVSAIAAMRSPQSRSAAAAASDAIENVLVIHDLSTTPEQASEFAACLKELAGLCESWIRIVYIDAAAIATLQSELKRGGWEQAQQTLQGWLGCSACDELILGQNLLFLNSLLARTFPNADASCYGDGLAINFSAEYYSPDHNPITASHRTPHGVRKGVAFPRWVLRAVGWMRDSGLRVLGKPRTAQPPVAMPVKPLAKEKYRVAFSRKYLLFANMLDEQWPSCVQLSPEPFIELFRTIASELHRFDRGACEQLAARIAESEQTIVILSSNFSETKRMDPDGEVACYREWVERVRASRDPLIVIKPHPRDSYAKIDRIRENLIQAGCRVHVLADAWTFYVPFESIFLRYIQPHLCDHQRLDIICTSSACLSLEYLFGQECHLGFGPDRVERFFAPNWMLLRQLHEADLHRLIEYSRDQHSRRRAA